MLDNDFPGRIYFMYKSTPYWIRGEDKETEIIIGECINKNNVTSYYFVRRSKDAYISSIDNEFALSEELSSIFRNIEIDDTDKLLDYDYSRQLTLEEFECIMKIIINNKDIISVNSYIHNGVKDGEEDEIYIQYKNFNRHIRGDSILTCAASRLESFKNNDLKDDNVVIYKLLNELVSYLESIGISVFAEEKLEKNKTEYIEKIILDSLNNSSMYYHASELNEYWPSIKLYSSNGCILFTSRDRKLNIVRNYIPNWNYHNDFEIIRNICENRNLIWCESDKTDEGYCYTISFPNKKRK